MALLFQTSPPPDDNQLYTVGDTSWIYNQAKDVWKLVKAGAPKVPSAVTFEFTDTSINMELPENDSHANTFADALIARRPLGGKFIADPRLGDQTALTTTHKSTVYGAINEVNTNTLPFKGNTATIDTAIQKGTYHITEASMNGQMLIVIDSTTRVVQQRYRETSKTKNGSPYYFTEVFNRSAEIQDEGGVPTLGTWTEWERVVSTEYLTEEINLRAHGSSSGNGELAFGYLPTALNIDTNFNDCIINGVYYTDGTMGVLNTPAGTSPCNLTVSQFYDTTGLVIVQQATDATTKAFYIRTGHWLGYDPDIANNPLDLTWTTWSQMVTTSQVTTALGLKVDKTAMKFTIGDTAPTDPGPYFFVQIDPLDGTLVDIFTGINP